MHNASSVTYPVGRSRFMAGVAVALWLAGTAAVLSWCLQSDAMGWRQGLAIAALAACGLFAAFAWQGAPVGDLAWDGQAWSWRAGAARGELHVALDLQRHLLVRWQAASESCWLWLEQGQRPAHWQALRRAVYSRARPDALPGAQTPAAKP